MSDEKRFLNVRELAGLVGLNSRTIYLLKDRGKLPKPLKLGGAYRWDRRVIDQWIDLGCPEQKEFEAQRKKPA